MERPTYYDMKKYNESRIFEADEMVGMSESEISEAEKLYTTVYDSVLSEKDIDEGVLGSLVGGVAGALIGPAIGRAVCKALGIEENGTLGKLLTSRLVTAAIGASLGK